MYKFPNLMNNLQMKIINNLRIILKNLIIKNLNKGLINTKNKINFQFSNKIIKNKYLISMINKMFRIRILIS
jgi:hypothetical protein